MRRPGCRARRLQKGERNAGLMQFQVLSHAGLAVTAGGKTLLCDPWVVGSCYWRSWWNYPPVSPELVASLKPDYIYLTHIHWDHFHGPSLRRLGKHVQILLPREHHPRMRIDLQAMGFPNIREMSHGETVELAELPTFRRTRASCISAHRARRWSHWIS